MNNCIEYFLSKVNSFFVKSFINQKGVYMRIQNTLYGINYHALNKINQEVSYVKSEHIKKRQKQYKDFERLKEVGLGFSEIYSITGLSKSEYYRIKKKVEKLGWRAIEKQSTKPKRFRTSKVPLEIKDTILKIRLENITYGKCKIKAVLNRDFRSLNHKISSSSIGRILNEFKKKGLIPKYNPSSCKNRKKRIFNNHAQRWKYGQRANEFGELIQIDHMTTIKNGIRVKHFSAIDPTTRFMISEVYSNATSNTAKRFLEEKVLKEFPFKIKSIQVDGGSEFMLHFENACKDLNIPLYVLPPSSPKYNGNVERSNRIMKEEFYSRKDVLSDSIGALKFDLKGFISKYNTYRPHYSLGFLTPMEYLNKISAEKGVKNSQML